MDTSGDAACPFVAGAQVASMAGQNVTLVCKVVSMARDIVTVQAADGQQLTVNWTTKGAFQAGQVVEFRGTVGADGSLAASEHTAFSDNFDFGNFAQLVGHVHGKYKTLFQ